MQKTEIYTGIYKHTKLSSLALISTFIAFFSSCTIKTEQIDIKGKDVRLTVLHTSDLHSRLLPYEMIPNYNEGTLGLDDENSPFGGVSQLAYLVKRERAKAGRLIFVDSGDCFQGAPIFNMFRGEVEIRSMSEMNPTAVVVGNHEFDQGAENYADQLEQWSSFPSVAANYLFDDVDLPYANRLGALVDPYRVVNAGGLKIAIIGMGNLSSMNSVFEGGNSLGIKPLDTIETVQRYVDVLKGQVDLIVVVSHLGLEVDQEIAKKVPDVDLIAGGHLHVALSEPLTVRNDITNEPVLIMHSGAFNKFLGRLDLIVRDGKIKSHQYKLFPVDNTVPEDADMRDLIEPYKNKLVMNLDLTRVIGIAKETISRSGTAGGDGPLGNLVAESMQLRQRVETDFSLTNTLGIRTNIQEGDITLEELYNVLPFENTITTMFLSGQEVQELFDYVAEKSSERGCVSIAQISGATFTMDCSGEGVAKNITVGGSGQECENDSFCSNEEEICITLKAGTELGGRCFMPLNPNSVYELAANDYIAHGGSGFEVLQQNTTQFDTGIPIRTAVIDYLLRHPSIPDYQSGIAVEDGRIRVSYGDGSSGTLEGAE